MSVLADRLVDVATALAVSLPPGPDLDTGLRSGHEGDRLEQLRLAGELRRLADAVGARAAGDLVRREDSGEGSVAMRQGDRTLVDTVSRAAGVTLTTAQQWCAVGAAVTPRMSLLGETLPAPLPRLAAAVDAGVMAVEPAALIARAVRELEAHTTVEQREAAEGFLVQEAQELTLRQLGRLCVELQNRFDQNGIEPREELMRRRRGIRRIVKLDGGARWILDTDPESDGWLKAALDARTAPRRKVRFGDADDPAVDPATADDRSRGQQQLDAMVAMAKDDLARDDGEVAGMPATMLVLVPLGTLQSGKGSATIAGIDTPIGATTARRLACQANIIPIVLGGESEVLDVGRAKRLFTRPQRLAMAARDRGCTWPGCEAPPGWCEAAHSKLAWYAGGATRVDDGALLCPYHHHRLDNDGWTLEVRNGIPYFIPPPWVDPSQRPRRGGRERLPQNLAS